MCSIFYLCVLDCFTGEVCIIFVLYYIISNIFTVLIFFSFCESVGLSKWLGGA